MTNSLKLLLLALESCRPDQVDEMLETAREQDLTLTDVAAQAVKSMLDGLGLASRIDAEFPERLGLATPHPPRLQAVPLLLPLRC